MAKSIHIPSHIRNNSASFGDAVCQVWDQLGNESRESLELLCDYFNCYGDRSPMRSETGELVVPLRMRQARKFLVDGKRLRRHQRLKPYAR